jgi:hypothetical protein
MNTNRLLVLVASLAVAAPVVGCDSGGGGAASPTTPAATSTAPSPSATPTGRPDLTALTAAELSARARTALRTAKTLRISASLVDGGERIALDVGYGRTGSAGSVTVQGHRLRMILIGKFVYIKAPDSFWRKELGKDADQALAVVSGKWLKQRVTNADLREGADFFVRDKVVKEFVAEWPERPRKIGEKTVSGVACLGLKDGDGILWIDKYTARPVQLDPDSSSKTKEWMRFSDFNAVREPVVPPKSMTIDTARLGG